MEAPVPSAAAGLRFFRRRGKKFCFDPHPLNSYLVSRGAAIPPPEYIDRLRGGLDPQRLREYGYTDEAGAVDGAALGAAVVAGIVNHPIVIAALDANLERAYCLCCYQTHREEKAVEVEQAILNFLPYYSQESYEHSKMFYRVLCALLCDLAPHDLEEVKYHLNPRGKKGGGGDPDLGPLNRIRSVQAVRVRHGEAGRVRHGEAGAPETFPGSALYIYSTPRGRRLMRKLGKQCKSRGLLLSTRIAVGPGPEFFCLRYKFRAYHLAVHWEKNAPGGDKEKTFWECLGAAVKQHGER